MSEYKLPLLPFDFELETKPVFRQLVRARAALAQLCGVCTSIPNQNILIGTLPLQEAKDSSAIENIITTDDDLYSSDAINQQFTTLAAKEVHNYNNALRQSFEKVIATGLLTNNLILEIQATLEENRAGFRKLPGTALKNDRTGQIIYTPPQDPQEIIGLMSNLEKFINDDEWCDWDPLVKMAVIHHQFESIHPFYRPFAKRLFSKIWSYKNRDF
jgi:Fic family protein